jgi:hypothetical protein
MLHEYHQPKTLGRRSPKQLLLAALIAPAVVGLSSFIVGLAEHPGPKRVAIELAMILPLVAFVAWNHRGRRSSDQ